MELYSLYYCCKYNEGEGITMKKRGYTLVELTIVVLVLGVVLGAVYMFFLSSSGTVESTASENIAARGNRLTLD